MLQLALPMTGLRAACSLRIQPVVAADAAAPRAVRPWS